MLLWPAERASTSACAGAPTKVCGIQLQSRCAAEHTKIPMRSSLSVPSKMKAARELTLASVRWNQAGVQTPPPQSRRRPASAAAGHCCARGRRIRHRTGYAAHPPAFQAACTGFTATHFNDARMGVVRGNPPVEAISPQIDQPTARMDHAPGFTPSKIWEEVGTGSGPRLPVVQTVVAGWRLQGLLRRQVWSGDECWLMPLSSLKLNRWMVSGV